MILLGSICASTLIFVLFKLFAKYQVDTFQAIVFNYFTAFSLGVWLFKDHYVSEIWVSTQWVFPTLLAGILFIGLFVVMGISTQQNGVGKTSIAVKMSMAFSILLFFLVYREALSAFKLIGIVAATISVYLISSGKSELKESKSSYTWMLIFLFVGSGMLDFTLNYAQAKWLGSLHSALFSAFGFGVAGLVGITILIFQLVRRKTHFRWVNVLAGILLGIPNFFSIYLLLASYQQKQLSDASILAITNVGVVVFSSILGLLAFREHTTRRQVTGLILALLAIFAIYQGA